MRIEHHPYLDVFVREDGCIYLPQSGVNKAHWTFGSKHSDGYRIVKIASKSYYVHRLVAQTFLQYPIPQGYQIDHANRVRSDNRLENIRVCTPSDNQRNTSSHDRVEARGGTHKYEDETQYRREYDASYHQARRKTHRQVHFADGSKHWIPLPGALELLKIPLKQRIFAK